MKNLLRDYKKMIVIMMVIIIGMGNSMVYANQVFRDVPSTHWAAEDIHKMNNLGIITGMGDGLYNPNLNVPVSQAVVMMARLLKPTREDINVANAKYGALVAEVGVEAWARDQMAFALSSGIMTERELRGSYVNGRVRTAEKLEIVRYLTRALGLEKEARSKEIIVLGFNDTDKIPAEDKAYVSMMVDIGVINPFGDVLGNFNPREPMTRAIMAKVLSVSYDFLMGNIEEKVEVKNKDISGVIEAIAYGENPTLTIKGNDNKTHQHKLHEDVIILLDNAKMSLLDLKVGDRVDVKVENHLITSIIYNFNYESTDELVEGTLVSLVIARNVEINIKDQEGKEHTYRVAPDAAAVIDLRMGSFLELRAGYPVQLRIDNNLVTVVVAETQNQAVSTDRYAGTVEYVDRHLKAFLIRLDNGTHVRIDTVSGTTYVSMIDTESSFNGMKINNRVTVVGRYQNSRFVANTVVIAE